MTFATMSARPGMNQLVLTRVSPMERLAVADVLANRAPMGHVFGTRRPSVRKVQQKLAITHASLVSWRPESISAWRMDGFSGAAVNPRSALIRYFLEHEGLALEEQMICAI